ncbi:MAG TPA: hypothetical protein VF172_09590 [Nitrososphaera sp.]|jgi:plastocyanin
MTVIWFNEDDSPHSVTINSWSSVPDLEKFDSGAIGRGGGSFFYPFTVPGVYDYFDSLNLSLNRRINVGGEFEPGRKWTCW